ncbi:hypothetical protein [uncultured Nostoc sp.]|uniref:hypothetical protein n=1 Tax=uncultured Nostoc sp. TaxID=340711 RepID=UPI002629918D|nr:hypothetical protein [uncultured Nostoc sp.]
MQIFPDIVCAYGLGASFFFSIRHRIFSFPPHWSIAIAFGSVMGIDKSDRMVL